MARNHGWRIIGALLVGIAGTAGFLIYGPFLQQEVGRQVEEAVKGQAAKTTEAAKTAEGDKAKLEMKALGPQGPGGRYQVVTDGKQTFLADLKEGRVWRYYHYTRDDGHLKEEEGFLPLPFFFGGKKYHSAGEVESGE
ncbi:MAG: hypothetical protein ACYDIC_02950 [Desulfobaccales bacterium]